MAEKVAVLDSALPDHMVDGFPATPYLAFDYGQVSGPYGNWKHIPLTVRHLADMVAMMSPIQRLALFKDIDPEAKYTDWHKIQAEVETQALEALRESLKT